MPDDDVRAIAVEANGNAWFATKKGVGLIERRHITLAEKAKFFEDEIDLRHRRTQYGYVLGVRLKRPGDKSEWIAAGQRQRRLVDLHVRRGRVFRLCGNGKRTGEEVERKPLSKRFGF